LPEHGGAVSTITNANADPLTGPTGAARRQPNNCCGVKACPRFRSALQARRRPNPPNTAAADQLRVLEAVLQPPHQRIRSSPNWMAQTPFFRSSIGTGTVKLRTS
jgi:hypothetical protein